MRVGASTPSHQWIVAVNHTRSGSGNMEIKGKKSRKTKFKQDVLLHVVRTTDQVAAADASTLGFVVLGDTNLQIDDVEGAMRSFQGVSTQDWADVSVSF